jgi:hypothetical protein
MLHVVFAVAGEPPVRGKLLEVDAAGVMIDGRDGPTFIPYAVIREIIVLQEA